MTKNELEYELDNIDLSLLTDDEIEKIINSALTLLN